MTRGIYSIRNLDTGDFYIGSTSNVERRWDEHRRDLRQGTHSTPPLQNAWNKYGEGSFEFKCIDEVEEGRDLLEVEQFWIDVLWPTGYNVNPIASKPPGTRGLKFSEATREKMRTSHLGKNTSVKSEDHREKIRQSLLGRSRGPHSTEHSSRISEGLLKFWKEKRGHE